jgi:hypothetical protein
VNEIDAAHMPRWLERQGWDGDAGALGTALESLAPLVRKVALDVDFTAAGIGRKAGVECYLNWQELAGAEWDRLLDHVAALGLCSASRRRAVKTFPGKIEYSLPEQIAARQRERGFLFPVLYRNIHHVKLTFAGSGWADAKAYLGVARPAIDLAAFFSGDDSDGGESGWYVP